MHIAICGAGIAGVATAYYLLQQDDKLKVTLIDKNQALSFTTSKSGENFRDYWPQACMEAFSSHSIDLMNDLRRKYGEDSFTMNFSGYNFITQDENNSIFGANANTDTSCEIKEITDTNTIKKQHPYLDKSIRKIVAIKKAGNIDVYAMGSLLIKESKKKGMQFKQGEIISISKDSAHYSIQLLDSETITQVDKVIIAAGPFINHIGAMLDLKFPILNTRQSKFIIPDLKNIIPRDMPFTIYADPQYLDWSEEEKEFFASDSHYKWLLEKFPGGLHIKPEGNGIKLGWAFQRGEHEPDWNVSSSDFFPQAVLKGASRFIPRLKEYAENIPTPLISYAGYYTRTKENWPLIGATDIANVYVVGALAGYGTMTACAAGELCAATTLDQKNLPDYAEYFSPNRYKNPQIIQEMAALKGDGQL